MRAIKQTANLREQTPDRAVMTWRRMERGGKKKKEEEGNESAVVNVIILNANHTKAENTVDTFWS